MKKSNIKKHKLISLAMSVAVIAVVALAVLASVNVDLKQKDEESRMPDALYGLSEEMETEPTTQTATEPVFEMPLWAQAYEQLLTQKIFLAPGYGFFEDYKAKADVYDVSVDDYMSVAGVNAYFTLYDFDKDEVPEIIIHAGTGADDSRFLIYSFNQSEMSVDYMGSFLFGEGKLCLSGDNVYSGLFLCANGADESNIYYFRSEDDKIIADKIASSKGAGENGEVSWENEQGIDAVCETAYDAIADNNAEIQFAYVKLISADNFETYIKTYLENVQNKSYIYSAFSPLSFADEPQQ